MIKLVKNDIFIKIERSSHSFSSQNTRKNFEIDILVILWKVLSSLPVDSGATSGNPTWDT